MIEQETLDLGTLEASVLIFGGQRPAAAGCRWLPADGGW